jgi:valyl-tRNA synthetase
LVDVLDTILRLLHPFMPFISEEIWQKLPGNEGSIVVSPFPEENSGFFNQEVENGMEILKEIIYHVRNIRGEMHIPPSQKVDVILFCGNDETAQFLKTHRNYLIQLALIKNLKFSKVRTRPGASATAIVRDTEIYIPLEGVIDFEEEHKRLTKENTKVEKDLVFIRKKMTNEDFLRKAPKEIVEKENQRYQGLVEKQKKLNMSISRLKEMKNAS